VPDELLPLPLPLPLPVPPSTVTTRGGGSSERDVTSRMLRNALANSAVAAGVPTTGGCCRCGGGGCGGCDACRVVGVAGATVAAGAVRSGEWYL